MVGQRRKSRELAVQILYEMEMKSASPKEVFGFFWEIEECTPDVKAFATDLVDGIFRNKKEIDQMIEKHSLHWKLPRMAVVDRNVLRLGVYELLYIHDNPTNVILNEAIEIAKKFGTGDSSSFINGVLDNVAKEVRT